MYQKIRLTTKRIGSFIGTHKWAIIASAAGVILAIFLMVFVALTRGSVETRNYINDLQPIDEPITIDFSRELGSVAARIEPKIEGDFRFERGIFGIKRMQFVAKQPLKADSEYKVLFESAKRVMYGETKIDQIRIKTQKAPKLETFSIAKKSVISMDEVFEAQLKSRAGILRDLELVAEPSLSLTRTTTDDRKFSWKSSELLAPDTEYTFILKDVKQQEELSRAVVISAARPEMSQPIKPTNVAPGDEIRIVFKKPIDLKDRPNIQFSLAGNGSWKNETEYIFVPTMLEPATTYTYTLPKNMRTTEGGVLADASVHSFQTNANVYVAQSSPRGYELAQGSQQIRLTFDQAVDKKTAEDRFRISSGLVEGFSWQANTLIATVKNLGYQQTVTVTMESGVQPIFGRTMSSPFRYSFTTEARIVKLNVPFYRQAYTQSCEAASLRMALAYRGVYDSDWNILQKFGYDPRPRDMEHNQWDDPNVQFVGDVNGNQGAGTGWGVYAGPVATAAMQYGRSSVVAYGGQASFVASQIYAGNPVIAWGVWRQGAKIDSWSTPSGKQISGPIPMHVRLVIGVKGEPTHPLGFYINDPINGPLYWTTQQFVANTAAAGPAAQLLAVY